MVEEMQNHNFKLAKIKKNSQMVEKNENNQKHLFFEDFKSVDRPVMI